MKAVALLLCAPAVCQASEQSTTERVTSDRRSHDHDAITREQIDKVLKDSPGHPADSWEMTFETGYLWNIGNNTEIDYEIMPTQLTFRSPTVLNWFAGDDGSRVVVRSRFSMLGESIVQGPEDYYIGINGAPSIEYWFPDAKTSLFFSIGGGFGWTNSAGGAQGQGQDFTLNWFSQLGVRREIAENLSILGGAYFIHHSNGGQTDPNPGIDALGFTIGLGWRF